MEVFTELVTWLTGWLSSFVLGTAKKGVDKIDKKVPAWLKKFQPVIIVVLSIILPLIGKALGIVDMPTAEIVAYAPVAAFLGIASRELLGLLKDLKKKISG